VIDLDRSQVIGADDKYLKHPMQVRIDIMNPIIQEDSSPDDRVDAKREIIREALDDIAQEVGTRLQEASLDIPIFLSVPENGGGKAILSFASPVDRSGDWFSVSAIVCEVAGKRLNNLNLIGHTIRSAMATAKSNMSVAEVTTD
jgi:hypothetical protein